MNSFPTTSSKEELAEKLKAKITSGILIPGEKLDSVRTIAKEEKCSQPTVVRAFELLSNEGYLIKKERKGAYVAEKKYWSPKIFRVGILTSVVSSYSSTILKSAPHLLGMKIVEKELVNNGAQISIHGAVYYLRHNDERAYVPIRDLGLEKVDAIIVAGVYEISYLCSLHQLNKPIIAYDIDAATARIDSAFVDDQASAFNLTNKLIEAGHKEIAFVADAMITPERTPTWSFDPCTIKRPDGYQIAMQAKGLKAIVTHASSNDHFCPAIDAVLKDHPNCTAMILGNAYGVSYAKSKGLATAGWTSDLSLKENKDADFLAIVDTTSMGNAAYELIQERINSPHAPIQRRLIQSEIMSNQPSA